jgi:hypothetical protein
MNDPERHGNGCNVMEKFVDPSDRMTEQMRSIQSNYDDNMLVQTRKSSNSPQP